MSKKNDAEVNFTFDLIGQIMKICSLVTLSELKDKIGIVTPYKG